MVPAEAGRQLQAKRWGVVPSWAEDEKIGGKTTNARAGTIAQKPAFSAAFKRRRCLIPVSGFYEWQVAEGGGQPWFFQLKDGRIAALAGL